MCTPLSSACELCLIDHLSSWLSNDLLTTALPAITLLIGLLHGSRALSRLWAFHIHFQTFCAESIR